MLRVSSNSGVRLRRGFTLIELMVAAALAILIMAIISTAFQQGLTTLSHLKSTGDLADRLRTAENLMRQDLEADHFDLGDTNSNGDSPGRMKLSDLRYDKNTDPAFKVKAPVGGFVRISNGNGCTVDGFDTDGISSTSAIDHSLNMTLIRPGRTDSEMFTVPSTSNRSRNSEVLWKLSDQPTARINGVPTYALLRYQQVLADPLNPATAGQRTLAQVITPTQRIAPGAIDDAIVLTNVLSFEVKPTWAGGTAPRNVLGAFPDMINGDAPFDVLPASVPANTGRSYDSSNTPAANANGIRITAIKVIFRIYDPKNKMTRQSSIIIKM